MTRPRYLEPRQTYLVTRRCSERRFLLRPDSVLNNLLLYLLSIAAKRYFIEVHAFAFLSNHYHLVLSETSDEVRLPEFMGWFNQHIAKLVNALRCRRENLWAPGSYNAVVLADQEAVLDKLVYTICNPVTAGLVEKPEDWEGLISLPWMVQGKTFEARNPGLFFKADMDRGTKLKLTRPPCFKGRLGTERFRKRLQARVRDRLAEIYARREREDAGPFLGMAAVMQQPLDGRPATIEPPLSKKPLVACKDKARRERLEEGLVGFQASHGEALEAWRSGEREVPFPRGTYAMMRFHSASCLIGGRIFARE